MRAECMERNRPVAMAVVHHDVEDSTIASPRRLCRHLSRTAQVAQRSWSCARAEVDRVEADDGPSNGLRFIRNDG